jgi:Copine
VEVAKTPMHYRCLLQLSAQLFKTAKLNLFLEVSKATSSSKNQTVTSTWLVVYRSGSVGIASPALNAAWEPVDLDLGTLCNGDLDKPIRIAVHKRGRGAAAASSLVGVTETTLRHLLRLSDPSNVTDSDLPDDMLKPNELFLQSSTSAQLQRVGKLQVLQVRVDQGSDGGLSPAPANRGVPTTTVTGANESPTRPVDLADLQPAYPPLAAAFPIPRSPGRASSTPAQPSKSFQDYLRQGLVLNLCVAVDFTSSNGAPNLPRSLHYQSTAAYNDYEEAMLAVCSAMDPYSTKEHSVWGFGAKFPPDNVVRHLFQCGTTANTKAVGTQGVMAAYKSVFQSDFIMSGPTVLLQVLQAAAIQAKAQHVHMANTLPTPDLGYTVLLIVTDGMADEFEETHRKLNVYGTVPLSVVIVGVGRTADFTRMHYLCNTTAAGSRPIATFVEFRSHQHDPASLGRAALQHIPSQVCEYMARRGF